MRDYFLSFLSCHGTNNLFTAAVQPTLTQLFGGSNKEKDTKEPNEESAEANTEKQGSLEAIAEESLEIDDEDEGDTSNAKVNEAGPIDCSNKDESDEEYLCDDEEQAPVVSHRISWKDGQPSHNSSQTESTGTMWGTLMAAAAANNLQETNFNSTWNRVFEEGDTGSVGGIDNLLELLGNSSPDSPSSKLSNSSTSGGDSPRGFGSPINLSMLTQRGQNLAVNIQDDIKSDKSKLSALNAVCPNWKENIAYALHQRNNNELKEALVNVQQSKDRLLKMKESFLIAWQKQQTVLDVFELSLNQSLNRLENNPLPSADSTATSNNSNNVK